MTYVKFVPDTVSIEISTYPKKNVSATQLLRNRNIGYKQSRNDNVRRNPTSSLIRAILYTCATNPIFYV